LVGMVCARIVAEINRQIIKVTLVFMR